MSAVEEIVKNNPEAEATMVAAYNSYMRNFMGKARKAAEADKLGEALFALELLFKAVAAENPKFNPAVMTRAANALLCARLIGRR
jgi:hypothetical protein